jgi:hypothetical protein
VYNIISDKDYANERVMACLCLNMISIKIRLNQLLRKTALQANARKLAYITAAVKHLAKGTRVCKDIIQY